MNKVKTIHIVTGLGQGGAETMLYKLIANMDRRQFENIVISMTGEGVFADRLRVMGVTVHCLYMGKNLQSVTATFKYKKLVKQYSPDVVQSWMFHANVFATLMKPFVKPHKLVHNVRQSLIDIKNNKKSTQFMIRLNGKLSKYADVVINNSKLSQQQHHAVGFDKSKDYYIGNGFDADVFYPDPSRERDFRQKYQLDDKTKIVGMFARYHPVKNHKGFLIVASRLVKESAQTWCFVLAGKNCDENNPELLALIDKYGLSSHITLLGQINSADYLPCLDIYLSTSLEEGFPNVVGEAMFCGVTPVVTNVGDCREIIGEFGYVSESGDYNALYKSCLAAIENKKLDIDAMVLYVQEKYSIKSIAQQYEALYKRLTQ